ncbi:MAG: electron transport complex subunit RsxC [Gammaproteobacteria bacterium]|nr:electron transport complex subunit RsxC [Gammaproteobacteria bacterium]
MNTKVWSIKLHRMHGGLQLEDHKTGSLTQGLQQASLPPQLLLPLKQHIGVTNKALVRPGDRVLRGQLIADSSSPISSPLHAPTSGWIREIAAHPVPHPSWQSDTCIVIDVDGKDEVLPSHAVDTQNLSVTKFIKLIHDAGIVGLGGASFPTSPKISRGDNLGIETLIINGVECEPYITCDDILMQTYTDEVINGIAWLQRILKPASTLIGIEDNKPEAIKAMKQALSTRNLDNTHVVDIPTIYPSGGEKQLIQILTGKEIPKAKLAFDIGLFCQNVGTCAAISRALDQNQPLISRIVTLSGDGIRQPGNWEVRLGTPISHLIELAGGYLDNQARRHLVMGGPMMGFSLSGDQVPIVKASNNILIMQQQTIPQAPGDHAECIRCSRCADVCPAQLLPQQLYWHARAGAYDKTEEFNLFDCIECGCCSTVCPSEIPLVQYYRAAKSEIRAAQQANFKSDRARIRFDFREKRLLLRKQQEEERRRLKREALKKKIPQVLNDDSVIDPVQAALARVKAKKQEQPVANPPKNTTNLSAAQQRQIEEADARRRTAHEQRA